MILVLWLISGRFAFQGVDAHVLLGQQLKERQRLRHQLDLSARDPAAKLDQSDNHSQVSFRNAFRPEILSIT